MNAHLEQAATHCPRVSDIAERNVSQARVDSSDCSAVA